MSPWTLQNSKDSALKPVLVDSGVIVALLDRSDPYHAACVAAIENLQNPLVTCEAVIAESFLLLRDLPGAPEAVLANIENGSFQIPFHLGPGSPSVRRALHRHKSPPIDFADACLIAMAEDLGTGEILTLDPGFQAYRWDRKPFQLLVLLAQLSRAAR